MSCPLQLGLCPQPEGTAAAQHRPLEAGFSTQPSHVLHVYTGWMPCPALHYLSYFVRVSVTMDLSCEELWRPIFTYAKFLLPDLLLHANMQTIHPVHTWSPASAPSPRAPAAAPPLFCHSRLPVPSIHKEEGGLGGSSEEEKSFQKRKGQKQKRATPLLQNLH